MRDKEPVPLSQKGKAMKETLRKARLDVYISAVISLIIGVLFIIFPIEAEATISTIIGIGILIIAVVMLCGSILSGSIATAIPGTVITILLGIIGIWIIANPVDFARIIPIAIGVMIVIHGISDFISSFTVKGLGVGTWWLMLIGSILSIVFGIVCIICSFGVLTVSGIIMGIMLIVDAIITFVITIRSNKYKRTASGDVEVESKVIK